MKKAVIILNKVFNDNTNKRKIIMNMETAQRLIVTREEDMKLTDEELMKKYSNVLSKSMNNRV